MEEMSVKHKNFLSKLDGKLRNSTVKHPLVLCVLSPGLCKLVGIVGGALVAVDVAVSWSAWTD